MLAVNFWCQFPEIDHNGKSNTYYNADLGIKTLCLQKRLSISLNAADLFRASASTITTTINNIPQMFTHFQVNRQVRLSMTYRLGNFMKKSNIRSTGNEEEKGRAN
jgi:hypothetical protein